MKVDSIVIVGGGSAGWLSAAALCRYFPKKQITLIESKNIPIIGVGESTTAMMKHFINAHLKISDDEFMKGVNAIYKCAVKFENFYFNGDGGYFYPFGSPFLNNSKIPGMGTWDIVKYFNPEIDRNDFVRSFFPSSALFTKNKINTNLSGEFDNYNFQLDTGYHLDATQLGNYLKNNYCLARGVSHIQADVVEINDSDAGIDSLILDDGRIINADLFIDCTGFKSLLLKEKMKPEYMDLSHKLPNNRAWATPIKYKDVYKEMIPYTKSTALKHGWAWYTPIANRIGNGYAYCDKFTTREQALEEFKEYLLSDSVPIRLTKDEVDSLPFFELQMKAGYYKESMIKNVVGIGLSAGFLEPLEGTGLYFVTEPLLQLVKILQRKGINQFIKDAFNKHLEEQFIDWSDTLALFYAQSIRDDSEYWKEIKNKKFNFKNFERITKDHGAQYNDAYSFIARGCDFAMDVDEATMDRWILHGGDNINYEAYAKSLKDTFKERKDKWDFNAANSLHIYDYLKNKGIVN
jgi:tryptophan halogenase